MNDVPQPKPSDAIVPVWLRGKWLTGSLFEFLRTPLSFYERAAACGDVVFGRLAHIPVCVLSHPRFVERVLIRETEVFEPSFIIRKSLQCLLGEGLLIAGRASSARQRPLVIRALHAGFAELWAKAVVEEARRLAASWRGGELRNFYPTMLRMVADVLRRVTFGEGPKAEKLGEMVEAGMRRAEDFPPVPDFIPTPRNLGQRTAIHRMDEVLAGAICVERANPSAQATLLSLLVKVHGERGKQLSDRDVRDQITMIHAAVLQNMAAVLTWTFTLLSENDQSYEEIRSEVTEVIENRVPTIGDASRLTRCANAVKEALRLYPPVWQIFRQANRDTELDGYKIRRGTQMMISEWVLQRDVRFFPEPQKFQPLRWENPRPEWEFAFFPFGAGPRACLGRELCFLASALILGVFAQRFRLRRVGADKIGVDPAFALRPSKPVMMKAESWASA
jgi:cytochrome P450